MNTEFQKIIKMLTETNKTLSTIDKENRDMKKILKNLEKQIKSISDRLAEFEIIMDAAEILEDQVIEEENIYNTDWTPYEDEDYHPEDYEDYDDEDDTPHGY